MKKVLVIGNHHNSYLKLFYSDKFLTIHAKNGLEGIKTAKDLIPDTIICNEHLPDINGFQVINELRRSHAAKNIPIILLFNGKSENEHNECMNETGTYAHLHSPINAEALIRCIESTLNITKKLSKKVRLNSHPIRTENISGLYRSIKWLSLKSRSAGSLNLSKIICLLAEENCSIILTDNGEKLLVRKQLKDWELILPKNIFLKISKSIIINVQFIKEFEEYSRNAYQVFIHNIAEPFKVEEKYTSMFISSIIKSNNKN